MDRGKKLVKDVWISALQAGCGKPKAARKQLRDAVDGDAARKFTGAGASHAVTDGKDIVRSGEGGRAHLAEEKRNWYRMTSAMNWMLESEG